MTLFGVAWGFSLGHLFVTNRWITNFVWAARNRLPGATCCGLMGRLRNHTKEMKMSLLSYIVRRIGINKGRPRVYLDSAAMTEAGFAPGQSYERTVDLKSKKVILTVTKDGRYQVCKKEKLGRLIPIVASTVLRLWHRSMAWMLCESSLRRVAYRS
jgi:hypothetical protein